MSCNAITFYHSIFNAQSNVCWKSNKISFSRTCCALCTIKLCVNCINVLHEPLSPQCVCVSIIYLLRFACGIAARRLSATVRLYSHCLSSTKWPPLIWFFSFLFSRSTHSSNTEDKKNNLKTERMIHFVCSLDTCV